MRADFRGRGIGGALTEHLIQFFRAQRVEHQLLVATSMGEPIYRKLGFEISSRYIFFARQDSIPSQDTPPGVRALAPDDENALFALDRLVTGEMRQPFLRRCLDGAWVHVAPSGTLDGYYLPALGTGLVVASNDDAGLALLCHKVAQPGSLIVVPEANRLAADFLCSHGFAETSRAPRMTLGREIDWQPARVYARGSGFSG